MLTLRVSKQNTDDELDQDSHTAGSDLKDLTQVHTQFRRCLLKVIVCTREGDVRVPNTSYEQ